VIRFIRNLNLARTIILFSVVGSCYLGWINWKQYQEVSFLRRMFTHQVAKECQLIQEKSMLHTKYSRDIKGDRYLNQASPESYIRQVADHPDVNIGVPEVDPNTSIRPGGIIDNSYSIRPVDRKKAFTHRHIASFLFRLEAESPQIKVTSIKLSLQGKNPKPDEIPPDEWTWVAVMTNRVKDKAKENPRSGG
jgi:hypothetical protein